MPRRPQLHKSLTANCICIHGMTRTFHSNHPKGHITSAEILLNSFEFHQLMYFWYQSCNSDSISSPSWLSEIQSYGLHGRPLPRFQVLLSFGDECLDPQRQRQTLTVQVTVHTVIQTLTLKHCLCSPHISSLLLHFFSFCTWAWLHIYWALKVESVLWKVKNMLLKLKHKIWMSVRMSSIIMFAAYHSFKFSLAVIQNSPGVRPWISICPTLVTCSSGLLEEVFHVIGRNMQVRA